MFFQKRNVYPSNVWVITVTAFKSVGLLRSNYFKISSNAPSINLLCNVWNFIFYWLRQFFDVYYIHTEIYTLKSRRVNFRSLTDVNQSNVAYRFSHMWEKRYVQSGAAYHVFSRVICTASWSFHSRLVGAVSYTAQAIALRVWREQIVYICISSVVNIESSCLGETESERRWKRIRIEESDSD